MLSKIKTLLFGKTKLHYVINVENINRDDTATVELNELWALIAKLDQHGIKVHLVQKQSIMQLFTNPQ